MNEGTARALLTVVCALALTTPAFGQSSAPATTKPYKASFEAAKEMLESGDKEKARDQMKADLKAAEDAGDKQSVAEIANALANAYVAAGDYTSGATYAKQAKDAAIAVLLSDPRTAPLGQQLAKNEENASEWIKHVMQADFAEQRGDHKTAVTEYQAAVDKAAEYAADGMPMATALGGLGKTYVALGDYAKAEPILRKAIVLCEKNWTPVTKTAALDAADALANLAKVYEHTGRKGEAEKMLATSRRVRETQVVKHIELPAEKTAS